MQMNDLVSIFQLSEASLRLVVFVTVFGLFSVLESVFPRRVRRMSRFRRWRTNAGMLIAATLLVRVASFGVPLLVTVAAATFVRESSIGLFNLTQWPSWFEILLAIAMLDLAIWFQHMVSHKVPVLWRLHKVHHTDLDLDASSALRFHPIEILLSAVYKIAVVFVLGPAVLAVLLFEILLNSSAIFNHANLRLPKWLDSILRSAVVTPDMHRVHHSIHRSEQNSNFGFCLSIWDRVFGTYIARPMSGHTDMNIGLDAYQKSPVEEFWWGCCLPFRTAAERPNSLHE